MPLASDLTVALAGSSLDEKVAAIRDVGQTLARLLDEHDIHHRDVKPENLYVYDHRIVVGDFGLAKRPDDPNLSGDKPVGPYHHLPSEVFVEDEEPDWERVDVYCLANTLWRLAVERKYPPRGQIRANEEDSLALLLPGEPYIAQVAGVIEAATSRNPRSRPTLAGFAEQLDDWLDARRVKDEWAVEYEDAEARKLAVLRWLVQQARNEPVFNTMGYEIPSDMDVPSDIPGLTEEQVGTALLELIEDDAVDGEAKHVLGRQMPRHFVRLYPTLVGLGMVDSVDSLTAQAMPLLRAFTKRADGISLPRSHEQVELAPGLSLAPAEAYFQMRLLDAQGLLSFRPLRESGGSAMFMDVHTTTVGKRLLYLASTGAGSTL
jgi:Protein kinase domain